MGGAASILESEKGKPLDLADLDSEQAVRDELIRVRTLLHAISIAPPSNANSPRADADADADGEEAAEEEESEDDDAEARAAARKKRLGKTGPGTTRSGRKGSVMSGNMRLAMAHTVGETRSDYAMGEDGIEEVGPSKENSPMPPARDLLPDDDPAQAALAAAEAHAATEAAAPAE